MSYLLPLRNVENIILKTDTVDCRLPFLLLLWIVAYVCRVVLCCVTLYRFGLPYCSFNVCVFSISFLTPFFLNFCVFLYLIYFQVCVFFYGDLEWFSRCANLQACFACEPPPLTLLWLNLSIRTAWISTRLAFELYINYIYCHKLFWSSRVSFHLIHKISLIL